MMYFEDGGRGHKPRNADDLWKVQKGKETGFSLVLPKTSRLQTCFLYPSETEFRCWASEIL